MKPNKKHILSFSSYFASGKRLVGRMLYFRESTKTCEIITELTLPAYAAKQKPPPDTC